MIYGETGVYPVSLSVKTRMIKYYCKLIDPSCVCLSRKMLELLKELFFTNLYKCRWLRSVVKLLQVIDATYLLDCNIPVKGETVSKALKYKLRELFVIDWRKQLGKSSKCDTYSMFKVNFEPEKYLSYLPQNLAVNLCKFRTSNHRLEIETMRYVRPFVNRLDRKCFKCTLSETGNEYHHLLVCPYFADIRLKYISNRYTQNVSFVKFLDLISSRSGKIMFNLAIFITESMKLYR